MAIVLADQRAFEAGLHVLTETWPPTDPRWSYLHVIMAYCMRWGAECGPLAVEADIAAWREGQPENPFEE